MSLKTSTFQALMRNATDAMKESRIPEFLGSVSVRALVIDVAIC